MYHLGRWYAYLLLRYTGCLKFNFKYCNLWGQFLNLFIQKEHYIWLFHAIENLKSFHAIISFWKEFGMYWRKFSVSCPKIKHSNFRIIDQLIMLTNNNKFNSFIWKLGNDGNFMMNFASWKIMIGTMNGSFW